MLFDTNNKTITFFLSETNRTVYINKNVFIPYTQNTITLLTLFFAFFIETNTDENKKVIHHHSCHPILKLSIVNIFCFLSFLELSQLYCIVCVSKKMCHPLHTLYTECFWKFFFLIG